MTTREVVLDGGSPWGFRMHGGADVQQPLRISRVNPGSKAANKGIREGDIITSINNETTRGKTNAEAHALLKNVGETLRLGLNEDCNGSPKRRQYKTVHQETHFETIKQSTVSSSSYTSVSTKRDKREIEAKLDEGGRNSKFSDVKINGDLKANGKGSEILSEKSTISSACSSAASTPSTLTESQGVEKFDAAFEDDDSSHIDDSDLVTTTATADCCIVMADNVIGSSRSRRRRRSDKKNTKKSQAVRGEPNASAESMLQTLSVIETKTESVSVISEDDCRVKPIKENDLNYRVESPKTLPPIAKKNASITKSRSLDDDEAVRIQELSETSETEDKTEHNAVVSEVESDVEWEVADQLIFTDKKEQGRAMDNITLELEEASVVTRISLEDESNLREFLEGLNLVTSPEEAVTQTYEKQSAESIKAKRAKKREELAKYFLPVYQNPRFLDVISEEGSDHSDKEQKSPNMSRIHIPPPKPETTRGASKQERMQSHYYGPVSERIVHLVETPVVSEGFCSTSVAETSTGVEVVFLDEDDDSTNSVTPSDFDESEEFADGEEDDGKTEDLQETEAPMNEERKQELIPSSQLTPPPTPENISPKTEVTPSKINLDDKSIREESVTTLQQESEEDRAPKAAVYVNTVSRSPSVGSESSSSRGTSLCTTRYNPLSSSIGDIQAMLNEEESKARGSLLTLRELCLKTLISLPFGVVVLEELAEVSQSLEALTSNIPAFKPPAFMYKETRNTTKPSSNTNSSFTVPVKSCDKIKMPERSKEREHWVGIATDEDPKVVVCLSPTQKDHLETTRKIPDEAGKLLDLHNKFMERRTYHEDDDVKNKATNLTGDSEDSKGAMTNRLLAIIRDSGAPTSANDGKRESPENNMYLYYEEKEPLAATLPRAQKTRQESKANENLRLSARNLSEWLQLARDKSKSDTQLNREPPVVAAINMRRGSTSNLRDHPESDGEITRQMRSSNRRQSLPQEFFVQQMQYLIQKEKEIQQELELLEEEKRKLTSQMTNSQKTDDYKPSQMMTSAPSTDRFRQHMYDEYMQQVAAREERKQLKVIKISSHQQEAKKDKLEAVHVTGIEDEFMDQVKKRRKKYGMLSEESGDGTSVEKSDVEDDDKPPVLVMDGESITGAKKLPKHLKEFVEITRQANPEENEEGIWSPGQQQQQQQASRPEQLHRQRSQDQEKSDEPIPPVWTPKSAGSSPILERKEFRPVSFESPTLGRRNKSQIEESFESTSVEPPWKAPSSSSDVGVALSSSLGKRIPNSYSAPASGFSEFSSPRLPRAQNPTITLLQKAREGQLPKGALYIEQQDQPKYSKRNESPPHLGPGEILYHIKNEYTSDSETGRPRKMADLGPRKFEGIGPTTKDGMPIILRSEVRDQNQSKWYKRMYDTIHKQKPRYDGRYPYMSGYLSEPEPGAYDSDVTVYDNKFATLDRRRNQPSSDHYVTSYTMPRSSTHSYGTPSDVIKHGQDIYKNQPGRIENYIPGHSSISEKEAKEWWDEVMDIFDGWLDDHSALPSYNYMLSRAITRSQHLEQQKQVPHKGYMSQALKESGYESDSTLVFRRRDDTANQLSPSEQREAYRHIQKGGDVPLHGLRKPAPERPKDDAEIEYIPISPTLTRIRVHKSNKTRNELFAYPINIPPHPPNVFATYKRTAPSSISILRPPPSPPLPPRRKSSRNNSTLRLISTMKVRTDKSPLEKRHETCFSKTDVNKTNVKYLRDKITCKLSPVTKKKGEPRLRVTKTVTASPDLKSRITSSLSTSKDPKTSASKVYSKTNILSEPEKCCLTRSSSTSSVRKSCRTCSVGQGKTKPKSDASSSSKERTVSLDRTFGSEKRKIDLVLPKSSSERLIKSPDLVSPTEVKKAVLIASPTGSTYKQTKLLSSVRNGLKTPVKSQALPVKPGVTEKGREILKGSSLRPSSVPSTPTLARSSRQRNDSLSPAPSTLSEKSKTSRSNTSLDSIKSNKSAKKDAKNSKTTRSSTTKENSGKLKKHKKDQLNDEIAKKEKKLSKANPKDGSKLKKCAGRAAGTEIVKKLQQMEDKKRVPDAPVSLSDIQKQKEVVQRNSFFQNLFLRDISPVSQTRVRNSLITEKTLALERRRTSVSEPSIGALKIYLKHTKPVTDSKFKSLDAALIRSRSASPKYVSWEDDKIRDAQKKKLASSERERSISLPPKLVFSGASRSVSPPILKRREYTNLNRTTIIKPNPPPKLVFTETSRPVSPIIKRKSISLPREREVVRKRSPETIRPISPVRDDRIKPKQIGADKILFARPPDVRSRSASPEKHRDGSTTPERLYFTETTRPVSPIIEQTYTSMPASDKVGRSPSYRKIRSKQGDTIEFSRRKIMRSRSASEADEKHYDTLVFTPPSAQSTSSIDSCDKREYQTYVKEVIHSTRKSDRFKDLNKFYTTLERVGELERTTSSADLRPRRKYEEEIIDYDRWREVRTREKAEKELSSLYSELRSKQKEKDFLFLPKYVEAYKWNRDFDRGLRVRDKSVENIKEEFEKMNDQDISEGVMKKHELQYKRDVYKPLWRGNSVVNLAQNLTEKRSQSEGRVKTVRQKLIDSERLLTHGIGSRIWSSLSMEQVNLLKNQLAEIYQNGSNKQFTPKSDYSVEVPANKRDLLHSTLTVRRNSDSLGESHKFTSKPQDSPPTTSSLTESDKKRLSQSLSLEVLERQRQKYKTSVSLVLGKETRGAIAAADANVKTEMPSPRTCYSLEMSEDDVHERDKKHKDNDFVLVLAKNDSTAHKENIKETLSEWARPKKALVTTNVVNNANKTSSTSETESGSTDGSIKTVIDAGKKDIKKKVEYFEHALEKTEYTPTIYKPAEDAEEAPVEERDRFSKKMVQSQSYQNLKELFGEKLVAKMTISPYEVKCKPRRPQLRSSNISPLRSSSVSNSTDSIYRSRSLSPYPDDSYAIARSGDVSKLKNKFELGRDDEPSLRTALFPRRCSSDPQLNRKSQITIPGQRNGDVDYLRRRYEYPAIAGRGRSRIRRGGVVSPVYLRAEDRLMPHINIISKIASLYPRKSALKEPSRSTEELAEILGIAVGEVERMRQRFESPDRSMSLLGHMFTSSPNLTELKDISPYLAASWTAHKYPKLEDNTRSLSSPEHSVSSRDTSLVRKVRARPRSASPPRPKVKLSSILKPQTRKEDGAKKDYDPKVHRPVGRYQPPVTRVEPVRYRSWWPPMPTHNRPTVTFKGVVSLRQ